MIAEKDLIPIGKISRTHGIHGEVELQFTNDVFDRGDIAYLFLCIDGLFVPFFFEEYRFKNQEAALFTFADVSDETQARALVGAKVYYPQAALPEGEDEELRNVQAFVGFEVLVLDDEQDFSQTEVATFVLGHVVAVNTTAATTVFVVTNEQDEEVLVPFHEDFVLDLNTKERRLLLQLPEGLLELN